jgi:hypothetical protein
MTLNVSWPSPTFFNPVDHFRWKELFTRFTLVDSTALINLGDPCKRDLRRRSEVARLLRLWVGIPPGAWMSVYCECCALSGRGLSDKLITRPEESYRLWCVVVCDLETSWIRRLWQNGGCLAKNKQTNKQREIYHFRRSPSKTLGQFYTLLLSHFFSIPSLSDHSTPISYSHYPQILFTLIRSSLPWSYWFSYCYHSISYYICFDITPDSRLHFNYNLNFKCFHISGVHELCSRTIAFKIGNKISSLIAILAPWLVPSVNRWLHANYLNVSSSM